MCLLHSTAVGSDDREKCRVGAHSWIDSSAGKIRDWSSKGGSLSCILKDDQGFGRWTAGEGREEGFSRRVGGCGMFKELDTATQGDRVTERSILDRGRIVKSPVYRASGSGGCPVGSGGH